MKNIDTMIFFFCIHKCFDPEEMLDSMPKLQSKSPTPQTESQYIPHPDQDREFSDASHERVQKGSQISKMQCQKQGKPNANVSMPADNKPEMGTFEKYMHHTPKGA